VRPPSMDDDEEEEDDVLPPPVRNRLGSRVESVELLQGVGAAGRVDGGREIKVASTGGGDGGATCDGGRGGREPRGQRRRGRERRRGRVELGQHALDPGRQVGGIVVHGVRGEVGDEASSAVAPAPPTPPIPMAISSCSSFCATSAISDERTLYPSAASISSISSSCSPAPAAATIILSLEEPMSPPLPLASWYSCFMISELQA